MSIEHGKDGSLFHRALAGVILAAPILAWVFRGRPETFWRRITVGFGSLGLYAVLARPELREERPAPRDVVLGLVSAGGLYGLFRIGDPLARAALPSGSDRVASIYGLRNLASRPLILILLTTIIGPSEELFWRGLVQPACVEKFGEWRGIAAATGAYSVVHLVSGNLALVGAAAVGGVYWGTQYVLEPRLTPLLVSHDVLDVLLFLIAPTPGAAKRR